MADTKAKPSAAAHRYRVVHRSRYTFDEPCSNAQLTARLRPRTTPSQTIAFSQLVVRPHPAERSCHQDAFGNHVDRFALERPFARLDISSISTIERHPTTPTSHRTSSSGNTAGDMPWEQAVIMTPAAATRDAPIALAEPTPLTTANSAIEAVATACFAPGQTLAAAIEAAVERVHGMLRYDASVTTAANSAIEAVALGAGVCQDFSHVMLALLRTRKLAARYVAGYLAPLRESASRHPTQSHAWVSLYLPAVGWWDIDPTLAKPTLAKPTLAKECGTRHLTVAWGRDFDDVSPLAGELDEQHSQRLETEVEIEPLTTKTAQPQKQHN